MVSGLQVGCRPCWSRWVRRVCRAGPCACWTATTWRRAGSALAACVPSKVRHCPGSCGLVHDPDSRLTCGPVVREDARASKHATFEPSLEDARPGALWVAGQHLRKGAILAGPWKSGAVFIVREHGHHPRLAKKPMAVARSFAQAGATPWKGCSPEPYRSCLGSVGTPFQALSTRVTTIVLNVMIFRFSARSRSAKAIHSAMSATKKRTRKS